MRGYSSFDHIMGRPEPVEQKVDGLYSIILNITAVLVEIQIATKLLVSDSADNRKKAADYLQNSKDRTDILLKQIDTYHKEWMSGTKND